MTRPRSINIPGPGHSSRDRSLAVTFDPSAPDGFLCTSFAGDDWRVCWDHVRAKFGLPAQSREFCQRWQNLSRRHDNTEPNLRLRRQATSRALTLWTEEWDPAGTPVERYLERRGIPPAPQICEALRYHPSCPFA